MFEFLCLDESLWTKKLHILEGFLDDERVSIFLSNRSK